MASRSLKRFGVFAGIGGLFGITYYYNSRNPFEECSGRLPVQVKGHAKTGLAGARDKTDAKTVSDEEPISRREKITKKLKDVVRRGALIQRLPFGRRSGSTEPLPSTSELSVKYADVVQRIRSASEERLGSKLPDRFHDIELARYALHYGIMRVTDAEGKDLVIRDAMDAVLNSCRWFQEHRFADITEVHEFSDLIWWEYNPKVNERPILHVNIGQAVKECKGEKALHFANVVITLMELAVLESPLSGIQMRGPIDRIDVEMYAHGVSSLSASRVFWILRALVKTLSLHYPGRLHQLTLYDLPTVLNWIVTGVKRLVHEDTARKLSSKKSQTI